MPGQSLIKGFLSYSGDGIISTSYADDYIVRGNAWSISMVTTLSASGSVSFLLTPSTAHSYFIPPIGLQAEDEKVLLKIYEDGNYSGGTPVTLINRNRNSTATFSGTLTTSSSGASKGTKIIEHAAFASSEKHSTSVNAQAGGSGALILNSNKKYYVEIENSSTSDQTDIEYDAIIFEIGDI